MTAPATALEDNFLRHDLWRSKLQATHLAKPILMPASSPDFSRAVSSYLDLIEALRARATQLDISRDTIEFPGRNRRRPGIQDLRSWTNEEAGPRDARSGPASLIVDHHNRARRRDLRGRYVKRDRAHTLAATRGHAGAALQAAGAARMAHKQALAAIQAAEAAAVKAAKMKAARLREKLLKRKGPSPVAPTRRGSARK